VLWTWWTVVWCSYSFIASRSQSLIKKRFILNYIDKCSFWILVIYSCNLVGLANTAALQIKLCILMVIKQRCGFHMIDLPVSGSCFSFWNPFIFTTEKNPLGWTWGVRLCCTCTWALFAQSCILMVRIMIKQRCDYHMIYQYLDFASVWETHWGWNWVVGCCCIWAINVYGICIVLYDYCNCRLLLNLLSPFFIKKQQFLQRPSRESPQQSVTAPPELSSDAAMQHLQGYIPYRLNFKANIFFFLKKKKQQCE
jgi:hypothetical protein